MELKQNNPPQTSPKPPKTYMDKGPRIRNRALFLCVAGLSFGVLAVAIALLWLG